MQESSPRLLEFLSDQIFLGPIMMMLKYKKIKLDDPELIEWAKRKSKNNRDLSKHNEHFQKQILKHKNRNKHKSTRYIRSLAKKLKLCGGQIDSTRAREFCLFVNEYVRETNHYYLVHSGIHEGNRQNAFEESLAPAVQYFLPMIEGALKFYKSGFILKEGPSYIDFIVAEQLHLIRKTNPYLLYDHPALLEFKQRIYKLVKNVEDI